MSISIKIDTAAFAKVESNIIARAKIVLGGSDLKKEVGDFAVERLKYQARIGKPFNNANYFPTLAPSTVANRQYLARHNVTHDVFSAERSNLTITGEFLDSLTWIDEGDAKLRLAFTGMHRHYLGAKGQRIGKTIMNETLAGYLKEWGFNVFDFSLATNTVFINRIKTICLRYIRRGLRIANRVSEAD